jgi:hypothetical protein
MQAYGETLRYLHHVSAPLRRAGKERRAKRQELEPDQRPIA